MLSSFRKFAKSWFAAGLIGLLILAFAVFGIGDVFTGRIGGDSVIKAGGRTVSPADFKREFDNFKAAAEQQGQQQITMEMADQYGLDGRVLAMLSGREAFAELLDKMGVRPSDKMIGLKLREIPAFFNSISGSFDKQAYLQKLGENQLTPVKFEALMRDQIAADHLNSALANGPDAPRSYSALASILGLEGRDVGYFILPPQSVPLPALPTDAQLNQTIKENVAQITRPEQRIITLVRFSPSQVSANLPIDPAELQKRFAFRRDTMSTPETRTVIQIPVRDAAAATGVATRLARGDDPAAVAKAVGAEAITYTGKPKTAIADRRVADAAFSLAAGQVSPPIQGELGMAVIKVVSVTPGRAVTLEEIRPQLEAELRKDMAAEKVYEMTQAYDDAHASGLSMTAAAAKVGALANTLPAFDKTGLSDQGPLGLPAKLIETVFTLPQGGESEIEDAGGGEFYVLKVERVVAPHVPPLAEIKPQLTRFWMMRELSKALQAKADGLAARVTKGESLDAVAASAGMKVTRVTNLSRESARQGATMPPSTLGKVFAAKPGEVFVVGAENQGIMVAKIEAIRAGANANLGRMTEELRQPLTRAILSDISNAAHEAARARLKVKTNPDAARAAIGLEPKAKPGKDGKPAKKTEKAE